MNDGGIIRGNTSKLFDLVASLDNNCKRNETIVKAIQGEVIIPERDLPNFINNISKLSKIKVENEEEILMKDNFTFNKEGLTINGVVTTEELKAGSKDQEIIIDEQEIVVFIKEELTKQGNEISVEDIAAVLDLEFEFLKSKGVIEI